MELHHEVQIERVLEGVVKFGDPRTVRQSHDVSLLLKEGDLRKMQ